MRRDFILQTQLLKTKSVVEFGREVREKTSPVPHRYLESDMSALYWEDRAADGGWERCYLIPAFDIEAGGRTCFIKSVEWHRSRELISYNPRGQPVDEIVIPFTEGLKIILKRGGPLKHDVSNLKCLDTWVHVDELERSNPLEIGMLLSVDDHLLVNFSGGDEVEWAEDKGEHGHTMCALTPAVFSCHERKTAIHVWLLTRTWTPSEGGVLRENEYIISWEEGAAVAHHHRFFGTGKVGHE